MSTPTLRDVQRETTRARLIEIVIEMMEQGGEQAVRVRTVADRLGASVGAVYHHFGSREDMIVAARIAQFAGALPEDIAATEALIERSTSVEQFHEDGLALTLIAHGAERSGNRQLRAEVIGAARHNPELGATLAAAQHEQTAEFAAILREAQAKGFIEPSIDARALAVYLQGVALGLSLADIDTIEPLDPVAWADLCRRLSRALVPDQPAAGEASAS